jgi:lipoprotein-releasing system permease protein
MNELRRAWERQRHLIDYSAASMARRKGRNLGLLVVYGGMVFLLASVLFYSSALKHEARLLLAEAPEIVVQRMIAGRHAPDFRSAPADPAGNPGAPGRRGTLVGVSL